MLTPVATVVYSISNGQSSRVYADDNDYIDGSVGNGDANDYLCVPQFDDDPNNDNKDVKTWKRLKFKFVNRATIRVSFEGGEKTCANNSNLDDIYIAPEVKFSDLFTQNLYDRDTSDGDFDYRFRASSAGNASKDESIINNFGNSDGTHEPSGWKGGDSMMTGDQFRAFIKNTEYIMATEEDNIKNRDCKSGTNHNFALYDDPDDGAPYQWHCGSSISGSGRGLGVQAQLEGSIEDNVKAFNITYFVKDGKIQHVSRDERDTRTFTWCGSLNTPQWRTENCDGDFYLDGVNQEAVTSIGTGTKDFMMKKDGSSDSMNIRVAGDGSESTQTNDAASGEADSDNGITAAGGSGDAEDMNCEVQLLNPLTWIACPLIEAAQAAVTQFDNAITQKLTIDTDKYFDTGNKTGESFYAAWSSVRTISLALLVLAGLVMVISQMISIGIFDAYTVKKILPRIVVAVVLTALSWELMKFAIDMSNAAGQGVRYIIYQPFVSAGFEETKVAAGLASLLGFGAGAALIGLTMLGMMSFALTALMAVIIGFGLIVFREMLIMLLVIAAPLAIACYILPNTQKAWKLWWDFFIKALLVFPIIVAMIAIGRVFAMIATDGGSNDLLSQTVGFIAYYGPYFLLPAAFRMAGGAMATISGVAGDKSRGAFDRLKKYRQNKTAQSIQKLGNYQRYSDKNMLGRGANAALGAVFNPRDAAKGRKGIKAGIRAGRTNQGNETWKNDATIQANQGDDNFLLALANKDLAEQKLAESKLKRQQALAAGDVAGAAKHQADIDARQNGLSNANRVVSRNSSATRLAAVNALAQTGYQLGQGEEGYNELASTVRGITGNDEGAYAAAMDTAQYHLKNAGRFDLAGINHGAGYDAAGGIGKVDPYTMASRAKPETIKEKGKLMRESVVKGLQAQASGDQAGYDKHMEDARVHQMELNAAMDSATGKNKDTILEELDTVSGVANLDGWAQESTGRQKQVRENFVTGVSTGWDPADEARGWRTTVQNETKGDVARTKARGARRPNQSELED